MSGILKNKIEAKDTNINALLKDQKFTIDYFQREYRWEEKHIKLLVEDLTATFLKSYASKHKRSEVANYQNYYLGPFVFSVNPDNGKKSIIDGQQRITSITLLLIYLNHLQNLDSLYRKMPKKSFTRGRKQEFEILMMYFWIHSICGDNDYWQEYLEKVLPGLK